MRGARFLVIFLLVASCSSGHPRPTASIPASTTPSITRSASTSSSIEGRAVPGQRREPPLPVALQESAAAVTTSRLYVVGGYDAAKNSSRDVFFFDGASWHPGPTLPIALNHPGAAAIGDDVYVVGGFSAEGASNRAFVLRARSSAWQELAPLKRARGALALFARRSTLYAIGGRNGGVQVAVPEQLDTTGGGWTDLAAMPSPRNHVAGYVDADQLCVAGGRTPATSERVDCFDPVRNAWSARPSMLTATSGASAMQFDGVLVVAGGEPSDETHLVDVVQELRGSSWTTVPMLIPRHGTAFAFFHDRFWMCGGATAPGFRATAACTSFVP